MLSFPNSFFSQAADTIFLYKQKNGQDDPAMFAYKPKGIATKAAVIIIPGGGYQGLAMDHEGLQVAQWYADRGCFAYVLRYSLGKFDGSGHKHPQMLQDAKRALRLARHHADKYGYSQDLIGIMGFSAGGHLASTLATHSDSGDPLAKDDIDKISSLPNFCVLGYPVINMDSDYTHWGSRRFLLGPTPDLEDIQFLSNEKHVTVSTPPTFIFTTGDDNVVPVQNSVSYYLALRSKGIPAELHIFEHGNHGLGLLVDDFAIRQWASLLENWLIRWKVLRQ